MVFSSVPPYIDPPNWNGNQPQQLQQQEARTAGAGSKRSSASSSMPERARLAKVPPPETALECPRCGSINTKFCYYNNYSLSQPRHFCKACRRYWTRGGTLRNVPVGGRNKRSKHSKATSSSACTSSSSASIIPPPVPAGFLGPMNNNLGTTPLSFSSLPSLGAHQQSSVESSFPLASGGALASSLDPYWRWAQHFPLLGITGGGGVLELPPLAPSQTMPPLMQLQQLEEGAAEAEYAKIQLLETEGRPGMGLQRDDRSGVWGGRNTAGGGGSGEWTTADIINQAFNSSSSGGSSGGRVFCNKQLE